MKENLRVSVCFIVSAKMNSKCLRVFPSHYSSLYDAIYDEEDAAFSKYLSPVRIYL